MPGPLNALPLMACARLLLALALAATLALPASAAGQPAKVALVIGNQRYEGGHGLANAASDARLMARTLASLGFTVTQHYDLQRTQLAAAVARFTERIPAGATAFVYYAGHGMQIGGSNYLNPVDMPVTSEHAASLRAYPLKSVLDRLALGKSAINIVVLDACRNNPFRPEGAVRYRSLRGLGLARTEAPRGTLIAYSTSPGQLAADGGSTNSIYTETLARILLEPGRDVTEAFARAGHEVRRKTMDDQIPWYESSVAGAYYLSSPAGASALAPDTQAGRPALAGTRTRGPATHWYRQMSAAEWSQVDWEIGQRVKRLTPDEIPALRHQANGGSVVAQTVLGLAYREGLDRARDAASGKVIRFRSDNGAAWRWLRKAAQAGFPVAQAEIGEMYYAAHGVERDLASSRHWLEQAAAADYPRARLDLLQLNTETGATSDPGAALRATMDSLQPRTERSQ